MKASNTQKRLQQVMDERGLKQVDILRAAEPFCAKYGVKMNRSDLSQYVNGLVEPNQAKLSVLAQALGVSETWLMGYDPIPTYPNILPVKRKRVPLLGTIAAGVPIYADQDFESFISCDDDVRCDFALRVQGDSMIGARIYDGERERSRSGWFDILSIFI